MINLPYNEDDAKKLNHAIAHVIQTLQDLTTDLSGKTWHIAIQDLATALKEFPSRTYTGEHYVRLTNLLHLLTNMRNEPKWANKLSLGELGDIADQLVQIIHHAVSYHEVFQKIPMPSLVYLEQRQLLTSETDLEKQMALFAKFDEETEGAFEQYKRMNDLSERKNLEMAAFAEELKKRKFAGKLQAEDVFDDAAIGMTELYAILAATALAGDIATTLHLYRGKILELIEHRLHGSE